VNLKWNKVQDATGYEIRYKTDTGAWTVFTVGYVQENEIEFTIPGLVSGTDYTFEIRAIREESPTFGVWSLVAVSDWTPLAGATAKTTGNQVIQTAKNTRPPAPKVGNAKNNTGNLLRPTIDIICLDLGLATRLPAGSAYVVQINFAKLPKKYNGENLRGNDANIAKYLGNVEIRIVERDNGRLAAVISGLPSGLKIPFQVRTVNAEGVLSAARNISASTAKYTATKITALKSETASTSATFRIANLNATQTRTLANFPGDEQRTRSVVVSYVVGSGASRVTYYATLFVDANGQVRVENGETGSRLAGFKTNTSGLSEEQLAAIGITTGTTVVKGKEFDTIQVTGLNPATKYTFALRNTATDITGNKWESAVSRVNIKTR
jgi:hypothetical protein